VTLVTRFAPAGEVRLGERIARRNICGGFVEWLTVTDTLDSYGCIDLAGGSSYIVRDADELVEIEAR
jgi:hypothetical protein